MGKHKRRNWQYKPKEPERRRVDPGLAYAMELARVQAEEEVKIRKAIAMDKEVGRLMMENTSDVGDWFFQLMALALKDEGFGAKRILRVCEKIRDYHNELNDPDFGPYELAEIVRRETGLEYDPGEVTLKRWQTRDARA